MVSRSLSARTRDSHCRACESIRHGTRAFIVLSCMVTGKIVDPFCLPAEALVRFVADVKAPSIKGTSGLLASMAGRAAFVREPAYRIVLHSTPNQISWMAHILSILVRTLFQRGRSGDRSPGVHRLSQSDDGHTLQMEGNALLVSPTQGFARLWASYLEMTRFPKTNHIRNA